MPSQLSESLAPLLHRFKDAWDGHKPPRIDDFLPPAETPYRLVLLTELIRIDIERRLSTGEPVRPEEMYLPRFPELHAAPEKVVALILHELGVRRSHEPDLPLEEYLERFPRYRNELLRQVLTSAGRTITQRDGGAPASGSDGAEETALQPGKCLGSYELLEKLGNGGMGTVFRARHQVLGKGFSLKVLLDGRAQDQQARARFLREIQAVGGLEHPNLVKATDAGEVGGVLLRTAHEHSTTIANGAGGVGPDYGHNRARGRRRTVETDTERR
jgi:hypothetical protein